jgi:hypothetical protein
MILVGFTKNTQTHDIGGVHKATTITYKDMLSNGQFRLDAVRAFLIDNVQTELAKMERGTWLNTVRDAVDEPLPVAPRAGLVARVAGVFV